MIVKKFIARSLFMTIILICLSILRQRKHRIKMQRNEYTIYLFQAIIWNWFAEREQYRKS